ncbi:hypothetical protein D9M68_641970 [compost metagenome]
MRDDAAAHGLALARERQPLRHAEAVLLVDDGQAQAVEFDVILDQRLRAHDQLHAAVGGGRRGFSARLGAEAAAQPGHVHAQRLQPGHQLAEVLFSEDFGGRHQRDLGAAGDGLRRGNGRHHGLAAAHVALQQAMHGIRLGEIRGDFLDDALLRAGQFERQYFIQSGDQPAGFGARRQRLGFLDPARRPRGRQRQLLRQQLVELDAPPRRMHAVQQGRFGFALGRGVQGSDGRLEWRQVVAGARLVGQGVGQVGAVQRLRDGAAQRQLGQPFGAGIDRSQRGGQRRVRVRHAGMDHLAAEKAAAHFAAGAQAFAHADLLLLAGVEIQPAQLEFAAVVRQGGGKLAPRPVQHLGFGDIAFDLGGEARPQGIDGDDSGFVFVAQRQVQHEILGQHQTQVTELALRIRHGLAGAFAIGAGSLGSRGRGRHEGTNP